jgi:hypothetical protein
METRALTCAQLVPILRSCYFRGVERKLLVPYFSVLSQGLVRFSTRIYAVNFHTLNLKSVSVLFLMLMAASFLKDVNFSFKKKVVLQYFLSALKFKAINNQ